MYNAYSKCATSLSTCTAHPYESYIKTLAFGDKEGKYFDLLGLGGEKYGKSNIVSLYRGRLYTCVHVYCKY